MTLSLSTDLMKPMTNNNQESSPIEISLCTTTKPVSNLVLTEKVRVRDNLHGLWKLVDCEKQK